MKILFNSKCLEHNSHNHVEGSYRIEPFKYKFEDTGSSKEGEKYLKTLYSRQYIEQMKKAFFEERHIAEVNTNSSTYEAACISVDLAVKASIRGAFAVTRPPGHHASKGKAEGFCFFNNIAIATQRLLEKGKKVCIVDIDAHHGNGTEAIFRDNPQILYCSLHQENTYPFTGFLEDVNCANFPIMVDSGDDILIRVMGLFRQLINSFEPDVIAISAGFDGYYKDTLLNLNFTKEGFHIAGSFLNKKAPKIFCCLEGGYHKEILGCTTEFIKGLTGEKYSSQEKMSKSKDVILKACLEKEEVFKKIHGIF
jgi:acetoin utilization deacetylase AcuC-like enzyme